MASSKRPHDRSSSGLGSAGLGGASRGPRSGRLLLPGQSGRGARAWALIRKLLFVGFVLGFVAVAGAAGVFIYYTSDKSLPTIDKISDYHPKLVTRVLASDGQLIGEIFEERRTVLPKDRLPRLLLQLP